MGQTLSQVATSAISHVRDGSEQHLSPPDNWVRPSNDPMQYHSVWSYRPFLNMELEVDPECELYNNEYHHDLRECCVSRLAKLPTTVHVSKEVPSDGQYEARALQKPDVRLSIV